MNKVLIKGIQDETDLRLIVPFGLNLKLGDVIAIDRNGSFTLEGTSMSALGMEAGTPRPAPLSGSVDASWSGGKKTKYTFRTEGTASSLFPALPSTSAGFDIEFGSENGWVLACIGRQLETLDELSRFRDPILDRQSIGVWGLDWALVTGIATAERMTLIASESKKNAVALSLAGTAIPAAPEVVKLTSGVTIAASKDRIVQNVTTGRLPIACTAKRVRKRFLRRPDVGNLGKTLAQPSEVSEASDDEFWEDVDDLDLGP